MRTGKGGTLCKAQAGCKAKVFGGNEVSAKGSRRHNVPTSTGKQYLGIGNRLKMVVRAKVFINHQGILPFLHSYTQILSSQTTLSMPRPNPHIRCRSSNAICSRGALRSASSGFLRLWLAIFVLVLQRSLEFVYSADLRSGGLAGILLKLLGKHLCHRWPRKF